MIKAICVRDKLLKIRKTLTYEEQHAESRKMILEYFRLFHPMCYLSAESEIDIKKSHIELLKFF